MEATCENCTASNNRAARGFAAGFGLVRQIGVTNSIVLRNCVASNNTNSSIDKQVAGFAGVPLGAPVFTQPVTGTVFDNCVAENNINTVDPSLSIGFLMVHMPETIIKNCVSEGNGVGIQFDVANIVTTPPSLRSVVENNIICNNSVAGIRDTIINTNNMYYHNTARSNGPTPLTTNYIGLPPGTPIRNWTIGAPPAAVDTNGVLDTQLDNISAG